MTRNLKKLLSTVAMAGFFGGAGCLGGVPANSTNPTSTTTPTTSSTDPSSPTPIVNNPSDPANGNNTSGGGTNDTFNHDDTDTTDPFQVLARIEEEGPPEVSTRMHSCSKMKYATMGNVLLADLMVPTAGATTLPTTKTPTAADLYTSGAGALGQPDYSNRIPEATALSTAAAVRLYDIFVSAAPTVVSLMATNKRCAVGGVASSMFDTTGATCTMPGIACLTGAPATQAQKDLCDSAVASNTTDKVGTGTTALTVGQVVAVASLLSAAHSCE